MTVRVLYQPPGETRILPDGSSNVVYVRHICIGQALDEAAMRWGDDVGWVFDDERITFRQMRERSIRAASALAALGTGRGDFVALLAPNIPEYAYLIFGAAYIGAIAIPINTRSKNFEIRHSLIHGDAAVLVMVDSFLKQDYRRFVSEVLGEGTVSADGVVDSLVAPKLRRIVGFSSYSGSGALSFADFTALGDGGGSEPPPAPAGQTWRDPVLLQFTSGTTALPKGALLNHCMVLNYGISIAAGMGVCEGSAMLNTQPFYHVGGSCAALPLPLSLGCRVVYSAYYEVERVLALIERERCVARTGFAAMYLMEMASPAFGKYDTSSIKGAWYNGPLGLVQTVQKGAGIPNFIQLYGATEGGGANGRLEDSLESRTHSCGPAHPGTEIGIADLETGELLPPDKPGEIMVRGWMQMNGYYKQPEETAKVMRPDGWLRMGDIGYLDKDGFLHFVGRLKNMIRVGGENVSAEEVEAVLLTHPGIKVAAAIGVPDERLQEAVMAIVELKPGESLDARGVIDFCAAQMANFRVPRHVRFVEEWPLTGSGKIQHSVLRERFAEISGQE